MLVETYWIAPVSEARIAHGHPRHRRKANLAAFRPGPRATKNISDIGANQCILAFGSMTRSRSSWHEGAQLMPESIPQVSRGLLLESYNDDLSTSIASLTVVSRRIVIRRLSQGTHPDSSLSTAEHDPSDQRRDLQSIERISDRDEVERLMATLNEAEADIVRLYHLEGLTYREISHQVGMPENSIGPTLSRARLKMRRASADTPHA